METRQSPDFCPFYALKKNNMRKEKLKREMEARFLQAEVDFLKKYKTDAYGLMMKMASEPLTKELIASKYLKK